MCVEGDFGLIFLKNYDKGLFCTVIDK